MSCRVGERDGPSPSVLVESICKVRNGKVRYTADSTRLEHRYFGSLSLHLPYPFALPSDDNFAMCSPSVAKGLLSSIIILFAPISVLFFIPGFSSSYGYGFVTFLLSAPLSSLSSPFLPAPFRIPSSTTIVGIEFEKKVTATTPNHIWEDYAMGAGVSE